MVEGSRTSERKISQADERNTSDDPHGQQDPRQGMVRCPKSQGNADGDAQMKANVKNAGSEKGGTEELALPTQSIVTLKCP